MAIVLLLPDSAVLALVSVEVNEEEKMITATARTTSREAACPICQRLAHRVQSNSVRVLADLPCSGQRVRWLIQARRLYAQRSGADQPAPARGQGARQRESGGPLGRATAPRGVRALLDA